MSKLSEASVNLHMDHKKHFPWLEGFQSQLRVLIFNLNKNDYYRLVKKFEGFLSVEVTKLRLKPKRATKLTQIIKRLIGNLKLITLSTEWEIKTIHPTMTLILTHYTNLINMSTLKHRKPPESVASELYVFIKLILGAPDFVLGTILCSSIIEDCAEQNSLGYFIILKIIQEHNNYTSNKESLLNFLTIMKIFQEYGCEEERTEKVVAKALLAIQEFPKGFQALIQRKLEIKLPLSHASDVNFVFSKIKIVKLIKVCKERFALFVTNSPDSDMSSDSEDEGYENFFLDTHGDVETFDDYQVISTSAAQTADDDSAMQSFKYDNLTSELEWKDLQDEGDGVGNKKEVDSDDDNKESEPEPSQSAVVVQASTTNFMWDSDSSIQEVSSTSSHDPKESAEVDSLPERDEASSDSDADHYLSSGSSEECERDEASSDSDADHFLSSESSVECETQSGSDNEGSLGNVDVNNRGKSNVDSKNGSRNESDNHGLEDEVSTIRMTSFDKVNYSIKEVNKDTKLEHAEPEHMFNISTKELDESAEISSTKVTLNNVSKVESQRQESLKQIVADVLSSRSESEIEIIPCLYPETNSNNENIDQPERTEKSLLKSGSNEEVHTSPRKVSLKPNEPSKEMVNGNKLEDQDSDWEQIIPQKRMRPSQDKKEATSVELRVTRTRGKDMDITKNLITNPPSSTSATNSGMTPTAKFFQSSSSSEKAVSTRGRPRKSIKSSGTVPTKTKSENVIPPTFTSPSEVEHMEVTELEEVESELTIPEKRTRKSVVTKQILPEEVKAPRGRPSVPYVALKENSPSPLRTTRSRATKITDTNAKSSPNGDTVSTRGRGRQSGQTAKNVAAPTMALRSRP